MEGGKLALSLREASAALGLSPRFLWALARDRRIPCIRIGSRLLFPRHELMRWLSEQSRLGTDQTDEENCQ